MAALVSQEISSSVITEACLDADHDDDHDDADDHDDGDDHSPQKPAWMYI